MAKKVLHFPKKKDVRTVGFRVAVLMEVIAWVAIIVGIFLSFFNVSEFNDGNMSLMVGMGFVIAGMMIYGAGTFVHLLDAEKGES